MAGTTKRPSRFWRVVFRIQYRWLRLIDPLVRRMWRRGGMGNVQELRVAGRSSGRPRSVLLGVLRTNGRRYLGHPNGDVAWTRNLEAAGSAELVAAGGLPERVRVQRLPEGDERTQAILATNQQLFPGNLVYRMARSHIFAVGVFFRIDPDDARSGAPAGAETPPAAGAPTADGAEQASA
ncbi:MAG: hypothetical protein E6I45_00320 [Chloroflexi bacterium]|nr:MAG: hypothetical protein E6I45_00320 [Chloroflexota bacterium]